MWHAPPRHCSSRCLSNPPRHGASASRTSAKSCGIGCGSGASDRGKGKGGRGCTGETKGDSRRSRSRHSSLFADPAGSTQFHRIRAKAPEIRNCSEIRMNFGSAIRTVLVVPRENTKDDSKATETKQGGRPRFRLSVNVVLSLCCSWGAIKLVARARGELKCGVTLYRKGRTCGRLRPKRTRARCTFTPARTWTRRRCR